MIEGGRVAKSHRHDSPTFTAIVAAYRRKVGGIQSKHGTGADCVDGCEQQSNERESVQARRPES